MKYDAFISYRHAELDTYIAKRVHRMLETFKVPRSVSKTGKKKKIARVFRDQEELPIGSSLTNNIELALQNSEFLIVICSPRTPQSEWVQREIDTFIRMHGRQNVLAVLIEGEPCDSFPHSLLVDEYGRKVEPLAADVRGTTKHEINKKMKTEVVRLAAPLLYCSYDDLRQRHRERKMRKMAAILSGVAVLGIAFGVYSAISASLIRQNYREKQINESKHLADKAQSLLEYGDRSQAAMLSKEALGDKDGDRPFVPSAQYALSKALHCYETGDEIVKDGILHHDANVVSFSMSDDGKYLVSVDYEERIHLWDMESKKRIYTLDNRIDEYSALVNVINAVNTDDGILAAYEDDIALYDKKGKIVWENKPDEDKIVDCQVSEDKSIAAVCTLNKCCILDAKTGDTLNEFDNTQGDSFVNCAISPDNSYVVVSHQKDDISTSCISVLGLKDSSNVTISVYGSTVSEMRFTGDDSLAVLSVNNVLDPALADQQTDDGAVEMFDLTEKTMAWRCVFDYKDAMTNSMCLDYNDATKNISFTDYNELYTVNSQDGSIIKKVENGYPITFFKDSPDKKWGFISNSLGKIQAFDTESGKVADMIFADTQFDINRFDFAQGQLAVQGSKNNDILILNYSEGPGMKVKQKISGGIDKFYASDDETFYAVLSDTDSKYSLSFFDKDDNSVYEQADFAATGDLLDAFFYKNIFVAAGRGGKICFFDPKNQKYDSISVDADDTLNGTYQLSGNLLTYYDSDSYYVVDLATKKIKYQGRFDSYVDYAVYSADQKKIYAYSADNGLYDIDAESGRSHKMDQTDYEMTYSLKDSKGIEIDGTGRYIAVPCSDSMLRILDTKDDKTICSILFDARFSCTVSFIPGTNDIFVKGDNNTYSVYDYIDDREVYTSSDAIPDSIDMVTLSDDKSKLFLYTDSSMYILDADTYEIIEYADEGCGFLDKTQKVICSDSANLYEFPYMDAQMLRDETDKQFGHRN